MLYYYHGRPNPGTATETADIQAAIDDLLEEVREAREEWGDAVRRRERKIIEKLVENS